jgi:hypothetical protein
MVKEFINFYNFNLVLRPSLETGSPARAAGHSS